MINTIKSYVMLLFAGISAGLTAWLAIETGRRKAAENKAQQSDQKAARAQAEVTAHETRNDIDQTISRLPVGDADRELRDKWSRDK